MKTLWYVLLIAFSASGYLVAQTTSGFEDLGISVNTVLPMTAMLGSDATGKDEVVYFDLTQSAAHPMLASYDLSNGESHFYKSDADDIAFTAVVGPDHCVYLATSGTATMFRFDPRHPSAGLQNLGKISPDVSYVFQMVSDGKGMVYCGTFPHAKIFAYDTHTQKFVDFGVLADDETYVRSLNMDSKGNLVGGTGSKQMGVYIFDPVTRTKKNVLPQELRTSGFAEVKKASDGSLYATAGTKLFKWTGDSLATTDPKLYPGDWRAHLRDGRILQGWFADDSVVGCVIRNAQGVEEKRTFPYKSDGARLFYITRGPGEKVYGGSIMPKRVFAYDPRTNHSVDIGNPVEGEWGEVYSSTAIGSTVVFAAYSEGMVAIYDETKPWHWGKQPTDNPYFMGSLGPGHDRPQAMTSDGKSLVFIGSYPGYGELGGGLATIDIVQKKIVSNIRNVVQNQSITALWFNPADSLLYGGTTINGGAGSSPTEKEAVMFVWNPRTGQLVTKMVPVPGSAGIPALTGSGNTVIGIARESNSIFVYDTKSHAIVFKQPVPFGRVPDVSLGVQDNFCFGLAGKSIFKFDLTSMQFAKLADFSGDITCGFALVKPYIYFASGGHLIRYRY